MVEVVDEHGLTIELEMRVRVTPAIAPTAPRERLLLRDAEHHHPRTPLPLSLLHIRTRDVLLDHVLGNRTTGISRAFANALTSST